MTQCSTGRRLIIATMPHGHENCIRELYKRILQFPCGLTNCNIAMPHGQALDNYGNTPTGRRLIIATMPHGQAPDNYGNTRTGRRLIFAPARGGKMIQILIFKVAKAMLIYACV